VQERPFISVIIPTHNEAREIGGVLAAALGYDRVETLVVDGGSDDGTPNVARSLGVPVVAAPRGRARQMNAGAALARGEVLLFLHADSRPPKGFPEVVACVLGRPEVVAGAFQLRFDEEGPALRMIRVTANWRSRFLGLPYGDQGIFVRRDAFLAEGGFPDLPIMEDVALVRRLGGRGRVATAGSSAVTSARRYQGMGVWKRTLRNKITFGAYLVGVPPRRIQRLYERAGPGRPP
jgi:hypothetical protein